MRPLFSIVIPTRDRPNLLKDAIQSALEQEFDDYEIIVSDNSTNSETQKLVSEFESKKIKYFRTPRPLDMPKSWEFALSKANGKFITFLGDDDLLPKKFLKVYSKIVSSNENKNIKVFSHVWMGLSPVDEKSVGEKSKMQDLDGSSEEKKYRLVSFTLKNKGIVNKFDAKYIFRLKLSLVRSFAVPHISVINKDFYDFIKNKYGRCFFNWAPDITFSVICLYELAKENGSICKVNLPLLIARDTHYSYGYGSRGNPDKLKEFLYQFEEFRGSLMFSPFKDLFSHDNCVYESFLSAFSIIGKKEVYKLAGKQAIRDFHREFLMRILNELEHLSKKYEFYRKYQIEVKMYFYFWKLKNFILGLIQDRKYVEDVLKSRFKRFLKIKSEDYGDLFDKVTFEVNDLKEALNIADSIVEEKLKELS